MRSVLLAILVLAFGAPAAQAAVTVDIGSRRRRSATASRLRSPAPRCSTARRSASRRVRLEGRRYPFDGGFRVLDEAATAADGGYRFERELDRNWVLRVRVGDAVSKREAGVRLPGLHAVVSRAQLAGRPAHPALSGCRAESGSRSRRSSTSPAAAPSRAPRAATVELERLRAGRYRSTTLVRTPSAWKGRRYASCFRYTGGSGMGDPRSSCRTGSGVRRARTPRPARGPSGPASRPGRP